MRLKSVRINEIAGPVPCQGLTFEFVAPEPYRILSIVWALPTHRLEFAAKLRAIAETIEQTPDLEIDGIERHGFGVR
jgi:hypothetical protein